MTRFKCEKCGTCCKWIFFDMPKLKTKKLFYVVRGAIMFEESKIMAIPWRCPHLYADNTCGLYNVRPSKCRKFHCKKFICHKELEILKKSNTDDV